MRAVPGWMCQVDWDYELGEAAGGNRIFASQEDLKRCRKCTAGDDEEHIPQEVVTMSKEDFLELIEKSGVDRSTIYSSNIGEPIYVKPTQH